MEGGDTEFQDWEVLSEPFTGDVAEPQESSDFLQGMIQTNYFSLDSQKKNMVSDDSDRSDEKRVPEFEEKYDIGFVQNDQNGKLLEGFNLVEHLVIENDQNGENDKNGNFIEGVNGVEHMVTENDKNLENFSDDSSVISSGEMTVEGVQGSGELGMKEEEISGSGNSERDAIEEKGGTEVSKVEKGKKSGVVWWKLPIEFLRYCVFKGPVWTVSVAATFIGFVILGRRLYKMKKKNRVLGPRITMDDKKISQFMSRAARLNEAFSVVKRVPVIRSSLPAAGVTPWPVVSLR